jgi:hypothetical protein
MKELQRVISVGGQLLFVVPVGRPRVVFNAHRIYPYEHICEAFGDLILKEFALIPDSGSDGHLIRHADSGMVKRQKYACGCFHFVRRPDQEAATHGPRPYVGRREEEGEV